MHAASRLSARLSPADATAQRLSPINQRRLSLPRQPARPSGRSGSSSLLFVVTLFAECIANDRPLIASYKGELLFPVGDRLPREQVRRLPRRHRLPRPVHRRRDRRQWLDDLAADPLLLRHRRRRPAGAGAVAALLADAGGRTLRPLPAGRRRSRLQPRQLPLAGHRRPGPRRAGPADLRLPHLGAVRADADRSSPRSIGIAAGAVQGYFGGWIDLLFQRFIEIWTSIPSALPAAHHLERASSPSFWVLLGILLLFSWVDAGRAWCAPSSCAPATSSTSPPPARSASPTGRSCFRHLLPNAMVATLTFMPFILGGSVTTLTSLDFLGFGLPAGSPSLGELLSQGKDNLQAPWLGITGFVVISLMLTPAGLHRRGGARRLRSAQDLRVRR